MMKLSSNWKTQGFKSWNWFQNLPCCASENKNSESQIIHQENFGYKDHYGLKEGEGKDLYYTIKITLFCLLH